MWNILEDLDKEKLLDDRPDFVINTTQYLTLMGSNAYGTSTKDSDIDIYGFCIEDKELIFPHITGEIVGFGHQTKQFKQFQKSHMLFNHKETDISIYGIVRYFQLCMENNPNMIDSLFTSEECVLYITDIGRIVKDNRHEFIHKGAYKKFAGYAKSQIHKLKTKKPEGKRVALVKKYGYDVKFAAHAVRLLFEIEQLLKEGTIDLKKDNMLLRIILNGEWSVDKVLAFFDEKKQETDEFFEKSTLQDKPNEEKLKELLLKCIDMHFNK